MKIAPNIRNGTLIDYAGKIAFELFTVGCNYRCPTCHSKPLLSEQAISGEEAIKQMRDYSNRDWINGVVICGGEPTLHADLPDFLRNLKKELGLPIKLDTNGSNPQMLGKLLAEKLVDYVAMDIKGTSGIYRKLIGLEEEDKFDFRDNVEKAIGIVQSFPGYEFRTTVVPFYDALSQSCRLKGAGPEVLRWMTGDEAKQMTEWVYGLVPGDPEKVKWYVQRFKARERKEGAMLDDRFEKENLPKEYHETPLKVLEGVRDALRTRFPNVQIR